ncbi:MAG TPA: AAA family ATPase, partial [Chlamydiales bacterium]|nr:AAA family ATPase [Chlamydiales bacterium]
MIKQLILNNLVLIDSCQIDFTPSFNVVTGETGAGKTALIEAIALALGQRADSSLIRKGSDKAHLEISFNIEGLFSLKKQLEESGIPSDEDEELIIRREITKEGKNRCFVNCIMVPLSFLQKIGTFLIDVIDQQTHHTLCHSDAQRDLIDLFGNLENLLGDFQTSFAKEKQYQQKLKELEELSLKRERNEEIWRFQLEEIQTAHLKEGEEEEVFEKHQKLAHACQLGEKVDHILKGLSENSSAVLLQVSKFIKGIDSLLCLDKTLQDVSLLLHESHIVLSEAARSLQSYSQNLDSDPNAFQYLENRLNTWAHLKKKYGSSFKEIEAYKLKVQEELKHLETLS